MWDLQRAAELGTGGRTAVPTPGALVMSGLPRVQVTHWERLAERPGTAPQLRKGFGKLRCSSSPVTGDLEQVT